MVLVVAPEGDDEVALWVDDPGVNSEIVYGGLHGVQWNSNIIIDVEVSINENHSEVDDIEAVNGVIHPLVLGEDVGFLVLGVAHQVIPVGVGVDNQGVEHFAFGREFVKQMLVIFVDVWGVHQRFEHQRPVFILEDIASKKVFVHSQDGEVVDQFLCMTCEAGGHQ